MTYLDRWGAALRSLLGRWALVGALWLLVGLSGAAFYLATVVLAAILAYEAWGVGAAAAIAGGLFLLTGLSAALAAHIVTRRAQTDRTLPSQPGEAQSPEAAPAGPVERLLSGKTAADPLLLAAAAVGATALIIGPRRLVRWSVQAWTISRLVRSVLTATDQVRPASREATHADNGRLASHE